MHLIEALCRLNAVDREWEEKGRLYTAVRQRLADQSPLQTRRLAQQELATALRHKRGALADGEMELATLQQKAGQLESELYGGGVLAPRELDGMRRELESSRRRISRLEDALLELMQQVDDLSAQATRGGEELSAFEERWAQENAADLSAYQELRARLQALKEEREALRSEPDARSLALYDELRRSKGGSPLAALRDGVCQVCRVTVPAYKAEMVERGQEFIALCEGCGRILHPG